MPINPKGPPKKPGLSIRGRVIFDTVRGVVRARPWPPKKPTKDGSPRQRTARAFGAANRACKVTEASWYAEHYEATRGTPLLPRDLMIAFMYGRAITLITQEGRTIYSMAARADVSKSLDVLGGDPGDVLVRGQKFWEVRKPGSTEYRGAQIALATDQTAVNYSAGAVINWNHVDEDLVNWIDFSTQPGAIIVPPDTQRVDVLVQITVNNLASGTRCIAAILKNGEDLSPRRVQSDGGVSGTVGAPQVQALAVPVVPGDYFTTRLATPGDASVGILAERSYFKIRKAV